MRNPATPSVLLVAAIASEPIRFLTSWFISRRCAAHRSGSTRYSMCPLLDFVNPFVSPVFRVLQYYAACLRGVAPRLRLLWARNGWKSFSQWARAPANADELAMLRRAISCAASWVYTRLVDEGMCWPWRAAMMIDDRLPYATRVAVAREFLKGPLDRLDFYFGRRLRSRVRAPADLLEGSVQVALQHWAWGVRLSIADTEHVHGRSHQRSHPGMAWSSFTALHINAEARLQHEQRFGSSSKSKAGAGKARAKKQASRPKKRTAFESFKTEWWAEQRGKGRRLNPCDEAVWAELNGAFAALEPAKLASYQCEARASVSAADR